MSITVLVPVAVVGSRPLVVSNTGVSYDSDESGDSSLHLLLHFLHVVC